MIQIRIKHISTILTIVFLLGICGQASSQNDEKYYYKLGKKYMITKDYETATKHFYKCASVAKKNGNENPNYYYYPLLMHYYGHGKIKQVSKIADHITELVPASPDIPTASGTARENYFNEFFGEYGREINKSDYIFLRHFIHIQLSEMYVVETFDLMEFAVRYHSKKSLVPLQASYDLMKDVYERAYKDDADPETSGAPFKLRLCKIFTDAAGNGSVQAKKIIAKNCK